MIVHGKVTHFKFHRITFCVPGSYFLANLDKCPGSLCHSASDGGVVDCIDKNFNLCHYFLTITDKAFILPICISCDKTFHMVL